LIYTFTKEKYALDSLELAIKQSAITIALDTILAFGDTITITFKASLSEAEETLLTSIVTAHDGEPLAIEEPELKIKKLPEPLPFAQPTFKTCNDASVALVTCPKGATTNIDYVVTSHNLYVSGGQIHVKNNEFGDYSKAQVIDLYGYLPQEMRAAFPAYPILNEYVKKRFIPKDGSCFIDTKPLNAHVPQGMVLRTIFTATNEGEDRLAFVNYDMQLKL
jgi:hypothetical protein